MIQLMHMVSGIPRKAVSSPGLHSFSQVRNRSRPGFPAE